MSRTSRMSRFLGVSAPTLTLTELPNGLLQASGKTSPHDIVTVTWPDGQMVQIPTAADGSYSVVSTQVEMAGNVAVYATNIRGAQTPTTIEGYVPSGNNVILTADLDPASDTGVSNSDHITKDTTPTIKGTGEANATITVTTPTGETLTTTVDQNGTWSVAPTTPIPDGDANIVVTEVTAAGGSKTAVVPVVIDTTIPTPVISIDLDANHDGVITAAEKGSATSTPVTISFDKSKAQVGDIMHISDNHGVHHDVTLTAAQIAAGKVIIPFALPASGSTLTVTATITDAAGNEGDALPVSAKIDTTAPLPLTAYLDPASDTGISNHDGITKDSTPTIRGTGTAGAVIFTTIASTNEQITTLVAANGTWSFTPKHAIPDGPVDILVTEHKGTQNTTATVHAVIDTLIPVAAVNIDLDANNDGTISVAERGNATTSQVTIAFDGTKAKAGDILHLSDDTGVTKTVVLTAADIAAGHVESVFALPAQGQTMAVHAYFTDVAGNASIPSFDTAVVEPTPTPLTLTAKLDPASDSGVSNSDSITNDTTPTIIGTGTAGATVSITVPTGEILTTTVAANGTWSITPTQGFADGPVDLVVTETKNGVTAHAVVPVTIDTTIATPAVEIDLDANDDGTISVAERGNATTSQVTISFDGSKAKAGDVLHLSDDTGVTKSVILTAADIAAGHVESVFALPAQGQTMAVHAYFTDEAGNVSHPSSDTAFIEVPTVLTLTAKLDPASDTGISNSDGITKDNTPTIMGTGTAGATVSMTTPTGEYLTAIVAANGTWSMTPSQAIADGSVDFVVTETKNGVNTTAVAHAVIDTTIPTPHITIDMDANHDGVISPTEHTSNSSPVTVTFNSSAAKVGDVMHISDNTGTSHDVVLTQAYINAGQVTTAFTVPAAGGIMGVQAYITDVAGNVSFSTSATASVAAPAPLPTPHVNIDMDTNNDGIITPTEHTSNSSPVTITFDNTLVKAGDVMHIVDDAGLNTFDLVLVQQYIDAGKVVTVLPVPTTGHMGMKAYITDPSGNTSGTGSDSAYVEDTTPLTLTAKLDPASDSGVSNSDSITNDTTPTIIGTGTAGATISMTVPTGGTLTTTVAANGTWHLTPTQGFADGPVDLVVTETKNGVTAHVVVPVTIDTTIPTPAVNIDLDANNDGIISVAERGNATTSQVTISFDGSKAKAGDVMHLSDDTGVTKSVILTAAEVAAGHVESVFALPAQGQTMGVHAYITDVAGNVSVTTTDTAVVQAAPPPPLPTPHVNIDMDTNNDGIITPTEHTSNTSPVTITFDNTLVKAGDVMHIVDDAGLNTFDLVLVQQYIDAGKVVTALPVPTTGHMGMQAYITDPSGNTSGTGSDSALVQAAPPPVAVPATHVTIAMDANNDGVISAAEHTSNGSSVIFSFDQATAKVGDILHITDLMGINDAQVTLTQADINAGEHTEVMGVPTSGLMQVTAYITDPAGNKGLADTDSATVVASPPPVAVPATHVTIAMDANNDGVISAAEHTSNASSVVFSFDQATAKVGDILHITDLMGINDAQVTLTQADINAGERTEVMGVPTSGLMQVTAYITDPAGNKGLADTDSATVVASPPPVAVPATHVTIAMDANNDGVISAAEHTSNASSVIFSFDQATAKVGDILHITDLMGVNDTQVTLTQADINAGERTEVMGVPTSGLMQVTGYITDPAGNKGLADTDYATVVASPPPPTPTDHTITGQEDTRLVVHAADMGITDGTSSIVVDNLPGHGVLQLNGSNVYAGQTISVSDINAGNLTFMPAANESGFAQYYNDGLGNMKNDYAQFAFHQNASGSSLGGQTMTVDITPVADLASVTREQLSTLDNAPAGHQKNEVFNGIEGTWVQQILSVPSSADTDGSEVYRVFINAVGGAGYNIQALANGTIMMPTGQYGYELPHGTNDFYVFLPAGINTQYMDINVMTQEVNKYGTVFDTIVNTTHTQSDSPLVLDLTGNGVHTTSIANGTHFDLNADGVKEQTGWTASGQGILAMDLNHDGKIDSGKELFGNHTVKADGTVAKDGYDALSDYDSNHDGVIDAKDVHFKDLLVWVDTNHDGVSQASELHSLADLHITSISLHHDNSSVTENGNFINLASSFTTDDGKSHAMADVYFNTQTQSVTHVPSLPAELSNPDVSAHNAANSSTLQSMLESHVLNHAFI